MESRRSDSSSGIAEHGAKVQTRFGSTPDLPMDERDRDLLQRQRELENLDADSKVHWEMIKKLTVCGVAFLNDAYDMFAINIVSMILGFVYFSDATGTARNTVPKKWDTLIKIAAQIGCLIGQVVLGRLGDKISRTTVYAASLMIALITTVASAFSNDMVKGFNVFIVLFIWRVLLGFGIGGDYPLTATIVSEYSNTRNRGKMIAAVFSFQGFGNLLAPVVGLILTACFRGAIDDDVLNLDYVWRLIIGLGCIPGVATLYWRLTMEDSKRFQLEVAKAATADADDEMQREKLLAKGAFHDEETAAGGVVQPIVPAQPQRRAKTFVQYFSEWRHLKVLLGTSLSWFALDVAFYGINLNTSVVIGAIGFAGDIVNDSPAKYIMRNCLGSIIINMLGSVPGYWIAVFTIEKLG
ncbi:hypothetical protein IWQ57_002371, partial [Coemansia nantahalensis]